MPVIDDDTIVKPKEKIKTAKPSLWACKFYNDDYTPMEFVVEVLIKIFKLDVQDAMATMMAVHMGGSALVGKFSRDVAETKATQVMDEAKSAQHPLRVDAVAV